MSKKKRKVTPSKLPPVSEHDAEAEIKSPSRGRFEERESDRPDGVTGNYS